MKIGKILLGSLASLALLVGCDNKEEDLGAPSIKLNPETVTFTQEGGEQTVALTSTRDWTVSDIPEWLSVSPTSGKASNDARTITLTALKNEGTGRSASLEFKTGLVSATLKVSQSGSVESNYATLESIRKNGVGTVAENTVVKVVVISSVGMNNLTSRKNVYVQDETAGIQIRFAADNKDWEFGAELEIDLSGQEVSEFGGALQVNNLPLEKVTLLNAGTSVEARNVTVADFLANKYECQYVAIPDVQVVASDLEKTFVIGDNHTGIYFESKDGSTFEVFSSKYSNFKDQKVPQGAGTLKGIASSNNGKIQIIFGQDTDWAGLTGARFEAEEKPVEVKKVTVAEFLDAPVGVDVYYELTGQIQNIGNTVYGNFDLVDETGTVYVYGLTKEKSPTNDKSFSELGLKEGDIVTLAGTRAEYNGVPQVGGPAYYISHKEGELDPYLKVDKTALNASAAAGSVKFNISSNVEWTVSSDNDSFNVNPDKGSGKAEITVTYPENTTTEAVVANIKVTTTDAQVAVKEYTVTVTQAAKSSEDTPVFTSNIAWELGESSYSETATVNGTPDVEILKLGKSKGIGTATITLPAGTRKIAFYGVAWKGKGPVTVTFSSSDISLSQSVSENEGAANNSPYTLSVEDTDYYELSLPAALDAETKVTLTTKEAGRVLLFGLNAIK